MIKYVLLVLALVGAVVAVPALRSRAAPVIDPVARLADPYVRKVRDPFRRKAADQEIRIILRRLAEGHHQGKRLPTPGDFERFLRDEYKVHREGRDPWGSPYYLVIESRQVKVGSAGPDGQRETDDDVITVTDWVR